jgi:hypothetical protein
MKPRFFVSATLILLPLTFVGSAPRERGVDPPRIPFCGFGINKGYFSLEAGASFTVKEISNADPSGIKEVVSQITRALGVEVPIRVALSNNEGNCYAVMTGGERLIIADHAFLVEVNRTAQTNWAAISVLAHEVGHHISMFSQDKSPHESELDADYWSGYLLQKLGASLASSTKCIMVFGTEVNSPSHPNKYDRAGSIKKGFTDAQNGGFDKSKCAHCE